MPSPERLISSDKDQVENGSPGLKRPGMIIRFSDGVVNRRSSHGAISGARLDVGMAVH